ncbi:hypothetical protein DDE83_009179 [Stemphylium lycopersici]|uniref:Uncharacterized protein n=1 Tax=Stemphylium lycopersici TaxID=183478 RepID=A0A364MR76_STELY|nr:hypothetical protein DDE83_009179 [Stemphylium lycopersici]
MPELSADKLSPECDSGMPIFKRCQTAAKPYSGFSSDYPVGTGRSNRDW